ncbi:MAG TPA: polysaccharide biosynthesis/export family protein [Terriglobales bacterium]|nr:polysaccharide biosynthesis/export family protein [Terriglobales bacterium]
MKTRRFATASTALLICIALAPAAAQTPVQSQEPAGPTPIVAPVSPDATAAPRAGDSGEGKLRLGPGDLLLFDVYGVPDMKTETRIAGGGEAMLPLIGPFKLSGLTPEEAQSALEKRYVADGYLKNPHISIIIKEYATQGVTVLGEVNKPGIYPILGPRRLFDVISAASGLTKGAGSAVTITRRDRPGDPITVNFSQDPVQALTSNVEVFPGDTVLVSRAGVVYVTGEVGRPGGYVMDNNGSLTVLQALALAGGPSHVAKLNSAKLIRKTQQGRQEVPLELAKIISDKAPDVPLQGDDILFIPSSAAKSAARRSLESIVSITTGLAIYRR